MTLLGAEPGKWPGDQGDASRFRSPGFFVLQPITEMEDESSDVDAVGEVARATACSAGSRDEGRHGCRTAAPGSHRARYECSRRLGGQSAGAGEMSDELSLHLAEVRAGLARAMAGAAA